MTTSEINIQSPLIETRATGEKLQDCFRAVYENEPLEDRHWTARLISKISVVAISALGDIPFIPVSMPLGKVLGPICAASNCATFFVLDWWSARGMINTAFGEKTRAEIELTKEIESKKSSCKTGCLITAASLVAILSQLPNALAAMEYNEEKYKVPAGLVLLVGGALLPIRSLQLSFEQIAIKCQNTEEAQIRKLKEGMIGLLKSCHEAFIKKSPEEKAAFIQRCKQLSEAAAPEEKTDAYTLSLIQQDEIAPLAETQGKIGMAFNYSGVAIGTALALLSCYASTNYTFIQTKNQIWDNNIVGGVFAALILSCKAYLVVMSIITTTQRIFNVCGNAIEGKETRNLSWQLRPKLSAALTAIGLLINTAALGPNYVIWGNFYTKKVEHELFQNGVCAALFLLFFTSSLDIIDDVVVESLAKGTDEEKKILKVSEEFKKLKGLVQECPDDEFVAYLNGGGNAPQALRAKLGIMTDQS